MRSDESTDYDFRHHLYDALILLGARREIAELLKKSLDYRITDSDVTALRNYNAELINETKGRLTQINTIKIRVSPG